MNWTGVQSTATVNKADANYMTGSTTYDGTGQVTTFQAGAVMQVTGLHVWQVNGTGKLVCNGTSTDLCGWEADGVTLPKKGGAWNYIYLNNATAGQSVTYTYIKHSTYGLLTAMTAAHTIGHVESYMATMFGFYFAAAVALGNQTYQSLRAVQCGTAIGFLTTAATYTFNDVEIHNCATDLGATVAGSTVTINRPRVLLGSSLSLGVASTLVVDAGFFQTTGINTYGNRTAGTVTVTNSRQMGLGIGMADCFRGAMTVNGCDLSGYGANGVGCVGTLSQFDNCAVFGNNKADPSKFDITDLVTSTEDPVQYGGIIPLAAARTNHRTARKMPLTFQAPALGASTSSTQVITATSDSKCNAWIEYGTASGVYTMRTAGDAEYQDPITGTRQVGWCGIRGDVQALTAHSRTLVGLQANTTYYYRARGESPLFEDFTASGEQTFTTPVTSALAVYTSALDAAQLTKAYHEEVSATGGDGNYTWNISVGALPAGLAINAVTGQITGTPTTVGTTNFTVRVTDGAASTATLATSITVNSAGGGGAFGTGLRTGGGL